MPKDGAVRVDIIESLHQRSMFRVLDHIFNCDPTTLFSAAQVSNVWRSVLQNSQQIWRNSYHRRVESDPIARMIHRRWDALNEAEAETNGNYRTLCLRLLQQRQRLITNRQNGQRRSRQIDLSSFNVVVNGDPHIKKCVNDDRLTIVCTLRLNRVDILIFDRWTLAFKRHLTRTDDTIGPYRNCKVEWNDLFVAVMTPSVLMVWDVETGALVLNTNLPLFNLANFKFTDCLLNCDNVLVASLERISGKYSKLFVCRLVGLGNLPPPDHRIINFPSIWLLTIVDMDRDVICLQLNPDTFQIRSTHFPFDLIHERNDASLFVPNRIYDRSWMALINNSSSVLEMWNFRTGSSHTLIEPRHLNVTSREIVSEYDDGRDQSHQIKLETFLSQETIDANRIGLTSNTTSCLWWKEYIKIYMDVPVWDDVRHAVLTFDYFD